MQNTYKGLTARTIAAQMIADPAEPAIYRATIAGISYRILAHRDTLPMANGTYASTLVLETYDDRIVLSWDGQPSSVISATVRA
ncbi:MAG TPA: hypothetical protein VFE27_24185 [Acidobacteriaceae bacterium]|jgi:hypothetical protein|nr:hypothetical protein [Acidobacteriaceae bacterium]